MSGAEFVNIDGVPEPHTQTVNSSFRYIDSMCLMFVALLRVVFCCCFVFLCFGFRLNVCFGLNLLSGNGILL